MCTSICGFFGDGNRIFWIWPINLGNVDVFDTLKTRQIHETPRHSGAMRDKKADGPEI
jgi:hypothetical protein